MKQIWQLLTTFMLCMLTDHNHTTTDSQFLISQMTVWCFLVLFLKWDLSGSGKHTEMSDNLVIWQCESVASQIFLLAHINICQLAADSISTAHPLTRNRINSPTRYKSWKQCMPAITSAVVQIWLSTSLWYCHVVQAVQVWWYVRGRLTWLGKKGPEGSR